MVLRRCKQVPEGTMIEILERIRLGETSVQLSREYGVARSTIDHWVIRYYGGVHELRRKRKPVTA